jgi:hypothetical protein
VDFHGLPQTYANLNAERERFELSVPLGTSAFKAGAFGRSATVPLTILDTPAFQLGQSSLPTPAERIPRGARGVGLEGERRRVGGLRRDAAAEVVDPVVGALPGSVRVGADVVGVAAGSRVGAEEFHATLFGMQIT